MDWVHAALSWLGDLFTNGTTYVVIAIWVLADSVSTVGNYLHRVQGDMLDHKEELETIGSHLGRIADQLEERGKK